jgi:hypothetical protein
MKQVKSLKELCSDLVRHSELFTVATSDQSILPQDLKDYLVNDTEKEMAEEKSIIEMLKRCHV